MKHDEQFVPADARGQIVAGAQSLAQTLRHRTQHLVAGRVSMGVVDLLEAVDVAEEHSQFISGPSALSAQRLDAAEHLLAVE